MLLKSVRLDPLRVVIMLALGLTALACNLPSVASGTETPTATTEAGVPVTVVTASPEPEAVCTPPACAPGEAMICPGDCPGGCGTICAIPTPTVGAFVPPEAPAPNAEYEGISFYFDYNITPSWLVEIVPAQTPGSGPDAWLIPSHYLFTFPTYPVSNTYQPPRIMVFPVENWQDYNENGVAEIERLQQMLDAGSLDLGPHPGIPVLPIFNAQQAFRARVEFMSFQSGRGIRFIMQYDQAANPLTNRTIFYTFQGLSNDGQYYVAAFFPISHPGLPDEVTDPAAVIGSDYAVYIEGIVQMLNDADQAGFTPDLDILDTMIRSLRTR